MCFSVYWFMQFLITVIVVCGVVALIRIWLLPLVVPLDGRIAQTINIIIAVIAAIFLIWLLFELVSCVLGSGLWLRR